MTTDDRQISYPECSKPQDPSVEGNHWLIEIMRKGDGYGTSDQVVRWCKNCGAVVVDVDYDGRTIPGSIMKLRRPKNS